MSPSPDEVRAELERVLGSDLFANAGRVSRLLRYVVERSLAGESDQLKEYVLGVEVFDRSGQYDPRLDSIVRVEARRLRSKLEEYYRGPGAADVLVIDIPRGSYAPVFSERSPAAAPATVGAHHTSTRRQRIRLAAVALGIVVVALVGWLARSGLPGSEASTAIRIAVLPFAHFSSETAVSQIAARITDSVTSDLARVKELSVVSRTSAAQFTSDQRPVREVAAELNAEIVMEGSVVVEAGGIHVIARLVDSAIDRKVWVGEYDSPPSGIGDLSRRIASEASAAVLKIRQRR